jgi:hypothetical protein
LWQTQNSVAGDSSAESSKAGLDSIQPVVKSSAVKIILISPSFNIEISFTSQQLSQNMTRKSNFFSQ